MKISPTVGDAEARDELVILLRGFFATPVMSALARLGGVQVMAVFPLLEGL